MKRSRFYVSLGWQSSNQTNERSAHLEIISADSREPVFVKTFTASEFAHLLAGVYMNVEAKTTDQPDRLGKTCISSGEHLGYIPDDEAEAKRQQAFEAGWEEVIVHRTNRGLALRLRRWE